LAAIGSVLGSDGPCAEAAVPRVDPDPPGRSVLGGVVDERWGVVARVAWVEDHKEPADGRGSAHEIRLHVAGPGLGHQQVRLYHYNPYFGTDVLLMRFYGDALVVIYHEKHNTYVVRVTPPSIEIHLVNVDKDPQIHGDVVVWAPYHEDLLRHLRLPGLAPTVPLPLAPQRGFAATIDIEDRPDGMFVRWVDRGEATAPGAHPDEPNASQMCRLRLPTGAQGELPVDSGAVRQIWQGLRARLDDTSAPPDGPDVLIATAAAPFWCTHIGRFRPSAISSWWFAAVYWSYLATDPGSGGAGRSQEAEQWLVWLEQLAIPAPGPYGGWDPTWGPIEGAVELGLVHLRRRAGQIAAACRAGDLPSDLSTRANWELTPSAVTDLPEGFLRAWHQIPNDFPYPRLNLSTHYN
jgi:hypothetical protein